MTSDITILNMTENGIISKKRNYDEYHIIYKNLNFKFPLRGYDEFTKYILDLKEMYEEHSKNTNCTCQQIEIPTANQSLKITLNYQELLELKNLFSLKSTNINLLHKMSYNFSFN